MEMEILNQFYDAKGNNRAGVKFITKDELQDAVVADPDNVPIFLNAINSLLQKQYLVMQQGRGDGGLLAFSARPQKLQQLMSKVSAQPSWILDRVWSEGINGVSSRVLRGEFMQALNVDSKAFDKALKTVIQNGSVTTFKNIHKKLDKYYIISSFTPNRELTGKPWYADDMKFDYEFADVLLKLTEKAIHHASLANGNGYAERDEILACVRENLAKTNVVQSDDVDLQIIQKLLDNLVFRNVAGQVSKKKYFLKYHRGDWVDDALTTPCYQCPVRERCGTSKLSKTNPIACEYMRAFLELGHYPVPDRVPNDSEGAVAEEGGQVEDVEEERAGGAAAASAAPAAGSGSAAELEEDEDEVVNDGGGRGGEDDEDAGDDEDEGVGKRQRF